MAYFKLACFINFAASFVLAAFVYFNNPRVAINRRWSLFQGMTAVWGLFFFLSLNAKSYQQALYLDWAIYTAAAAIPFLYLHFAYAMVGRDSYFGLALRFCRWAMIVFMLLNFTPLFRAGMKTTMYFPYLIVPGWAFYLFLIYFIFCPVYGNILLYRALKKAQGNKRNQLWYILVAASICFIAGGSNLLPQLFSVAAYGNYVVVLYMVVIVYAIVKYQLMDIRLAITRATVFVVVYAFILGVPFWMVMALKEKLSVLVGGNWPLIPVAIAGILFALGPMVYNYLSGKAEQALFLKYRKYQQILRNLAKTINGMKGESIILPTVLDKVYSALEPAYMAFYIYNPVQNNYNRAYYLPHDFSALPQSIGTNAAIIHSLWDIKTAVVRDELDGNIMLPSSAMVVPLFVRKALYGFAVIGERKRIGPYAQDDIGQAEFLSSQVSLALENSFLEEEKVVAAREEQLRRNRSIDNFSASLAHEINNPAFAIMGIADMVKIRLLEDISPRLNEKEKRYFDERLTQLSSDARRIAKLVKAVREFASSSSSEPVAVNVANLIDSFKDIIGGQLKEENIDFNVDIEDDFNVPGSKVHLEEVLVNFAINSVHALHSRGGENKLISLRVRKNTPRTVLFEFKDNGCGINPALLEDIFLDFVTTKGSSEGMGMGLARARKIVTLYGGRIWAHSDGEGKGATLFVELPAL